MEKPKSCNQKLAVPMHKIMSSPMSLFVYYMSQPIKYIFKSGELHHLLDVD